LPAPDGKPYDWLWQSQADAALAVSVGYRFTPHFRGEIETSYGQSTLTSVHAPGADDNGVSLSRPLEPYGLCSETSVLPSCTSTAHAPGNWAYMWSGMMNAIYDVFPNRRLDPFVGTGVGVAHVEWAADSQIYLFSKVPGVISASNPAVQSFKDAGSLNQPSQFAVQFLGGLSYRLTPSLNLVATYYYYFTTGALRWNPENYTRGLPAGAGLRPGDFLGRFQDDSVILSLRYAF
jgi:opacity protein-like surface antigen